MGSSKTKIDGSFEKNHYWRGREWPYRNVVPKIIAEEYIGVTEEIPIDYKVLCFDGQPRLIEVHANRFTDEHVELFMIRIGTSVHIKRMPTKLRNPII